MITRYPEETKWSIWRRQANQNSGKPWRNTKGLPLAGPARTTCNAIPLIWKTRNSRGERMPDSVIKPVSDFPTSDALEPRFFTFGAWRGLVFASCAIDESSFARDNVVE